SINLVDPTGMSIMLGTGARYQQITALIGRIYSFGRFVLRNTIFHSNPIIAGGSQGAAGYLLGMVWYNAEHRKPIEEGINGEDLLKAMVIGAAVAQANDAAAKFGTWGRANIGSRATVYEFIALVINAVMIGWVPDMG